MNAPATAPVQIHLYQAALAPRCEALVVHCSDPRLQVAFRQFVETELGLFTGQFMPLVVSGGAGVLAHPERLPKEFKFMRDRLEFYRALMPSLRRVVLINHEGCRYSQSLNKRVVGARGLAADRGHDDLRVVRAALAPTLAHLELEAVHYYARFADDKHTQVSFEQVD